LVCLGGFCGGALGFANNVTREISPNYRRQSAGITTEVRTVWAAYDLLMPSERGRELKIEVKSAAYLQAGNRTSIL